MGKGIIIFYSFLILIQSFNINTESILKLSAFMEHASYHKDLYGDNFVTFLSEHYGNLMASHQNEHKEHEDLPFKDHHNHMLCHASTPFILNQSTFYLTVQNFFKEQSKNFFYKEFFSSFEKPSVFQPPKVA
ncbi:hypothetical protein KO566_08855 [Flavobacteriaceae bacterium XHP0103]|uniref:hypothetical protein n=1 Tax=Marixanthotalea marina TaxID=2844359 RepID=UPI002989AF0D|nr:hypothetical protein [Marixanthotalea marina]MBU3822166.1 hypothetical protein [Marixanthotalea marina]